MSDLINSVLNEVGITAPVDKFPNQRSGALSSDALAGRVSAARTGAGQNRDLGHDLANLSDVELNVIYGRETSLYRDDMSAELTRQRSVLGAERSAGQILGDTALGVASGFVGVVGGLESAAIGLAGKALGSEGTQRYAVDVAQTTNDVTNFISSFQSDPLSERKRLSEAEGREDAARSEEQYYQDVRQGNDSFMAGLSMVGRDVIDTGERILRDGAVTGDVVAQGIGSLGPSAKMAAAFSSLVPRQAAVLADAIHPTVTSGRVAAAATVAEKAAIGLGVGLSEASGTYSSTAEEVMTRTHAEMLKSPQYVDYIAKGMDPLDAQKLVASNTAAEAFARQLPMATAAGMLASKFESSPLNAFNGQSFVEGLRQVGVQALEEGIQGGAGQLNQNIAIQNQVDPTQLLGEGVGEQISTGMIAGAGMAGIIAGPTMVNEAMDSAVQTAVDAASVVPKAVLNTVRDIPAGDILKAVGEGASSLGSEVRDVASNIAASLSENAGPTVSKVVDAAKGLKDAVVPTISAAVSSATQAAENYVSQPNTKIQSDILELGASVANKAKAMVAAAPDQVTASVQRLTTMAQNVTVPDGFKDTVAQGSSLIDTVNGMLKSFATPGTMSALSDSAVLFASQKFNELQSLATDLPDTLKTEVQKVLASKDFVRIQKRAARIDMNDLLEPEISTSPDVKATTISLARTNPANVNPEVVSYILEQDDRTDLTDEDVRLMTSAAKIARVVNDRVGRMVDISKEKTVALSKRTGNQEEAKTADQFSRSIQVEGLTSQDASGKRIQLRSVNDFASDIFKGSQDLDRRVMDNGVKVPVEAVANQFSMFVRHMTNKVEALNASYDQNDSKGSGPSVGFESLYQGREMVPAGDSRGAKQVAFHRKSEKSTEFAQIVHADAVAAAEVYNVLVETFPDLFPNGPVQIPQLRGMNQEATQVPVEVSPPEGRRKGFKDLEIESQDQALEDTPQEIAPVQEPTQPTPEETTTAVEDASSAPAEEVVEQTAEVEQEVEPQADTQPSGLTQKFQDTFTAKDKPVSYTDGQSLLDLISQKEHTEGYLEFATPLLPYLVEQMNERLQTLFFNKKNGPTLVEMMKNGEADKVLAIRDYKAMMFVDPNTGLYDERLLSLASMSVIDWMTSARSVGAGRLDDALDELGLNRFDMTEDDLFTIMNTVPTRMTSETIARDVIRLWNVDADLDAQMVDIRGAVEGLVKEIFTVLATDTDFVSIVEVKVKTEDGKDGGASAFDISGLRDVQEQIGMVGKNSLQKALFPELTTFASIGEIIEGTDQTQTRGDVPLTALEKSALKRMQDTAHYIATPVVNLIQAIGYDGIFRLLGGKDSSTLPKNHPLKVSIEGKNMSIERDYRDAIDMVAGIAIMDSGNGPVPVYYPVGISKVGRHQMKGVNPQNNKILRAMVTPTHATLDMTKQADRDAFWLTVAQASGLAKVENLSHSEILSTIQAKMKSKYGEAITLIETFLETGNLNTEALISSLGSTEVAQLNAILAVAQLNQAKKNGTSGQFQTTLSFELDGKTDGPANMMNNFGQGLLTPSDMENFKKVGLFLGQTDMTLNTYFTEKDDQGNLKNKDLYDTTARKGEFELFKMVADSSSEGKAKLYAVQRFAAIFGDFKMNEDGSITMTRNTAKNPMTKTVYGSGVKGVGEGIAEDMMLEFYAQLVELGEGVDLATHFNYPNIEQDLSLLFGQKFPAALNQFEFQFTKSAQAVFKDFVTKTVGTILSQSSKTVVGDKITDVNDLLVFITGVQTQFMQDLFNQRLEALVAKRAAEGKIATNAQGKGVMRQLSQRDYNDLVKEIRAYAPIYSNGSQTLSISTFSGQASDVEMSSNMNGNIRAKSTLPRPDIAGVKIIPYISIGRGDASMMNTIYGTEDGPSDTIPVFDGIDMPVNKVLAYANQINGAVLNNWDQDVLGPILEDFNRFLGSIGADKALLDRAFAQVAKTSFESSVVKKQIRTVDGLQRALVEARRQNMARKAVFKRIPLSVDHMGGSGTSYVRNAEAQSLSLAQINQMIQAELDGISISKDDVLVEDFVPEPHVEQVQEREPVEGEFSKLIIMDTVDLMKGLERETRNKNVRDTVRVLQKILTNPGKVVVGSVEEISAQLKASGNRDQSLLNRKGLYDYNNNTIYLLDNNHETLTHELIHMATFEKVLSHYQGTETNDAVVRLEGLMNEFMEMDFTGSQKPLRDAANSAKAQILKNLTSDDVFQKAAALNEFMAWTLSNKDLIGKLKTTETSTIQNLTKRVIAWMQRLLGNIPSDMYSNILFNTQILAEGSSDTNQDPNEFGPTDGNGSNGSTGADATGSDGGGDNIGGGGSSDVTPPFQQHTNFWIDLMRSRLEAANAGQVTGKKAQYIRYVQTAEDAVKKLDFGGFALSQYQRQTFMAIHGVMAMEMRLDTKSLLVTNKIYDHVTDNLTPGMFGIGKAAEERYSTVMDLMGATKNDEGVSDAIAVLLALSQTSTAFRNALDHIPQPETEGGVSLSSLNEALATLTVMLMRKAVGSVDIANQNMKEVLDNLSDSILKQDQDQEYRVLKGLMASMDKADAFFGGAMRQLAVGAEKINHDLQNSDRNGLTKTVAGAVLMSTAFLDADLSKNVSGQAKDMFHMGARLDKFVPIREFVTELVGTDDINAKTIQLLDRVNSSVQGARQAYREELPVILQNEFETHPDAEQWTALHKVLGKSDFSSLFNLKNPDDAMTLLSDDARLARKISDKEKIIRKNFSGQMATDILEKSQQLADFMNGKGAGHQLFKNAYAIHTLVGGARPNMIPEIDALVSLYAIEGADPAQKEAVVAMHDADPTAVHNLIVYMQGLNKEEDMKTISEAARLNGYKGYIPDHGKGESSLIVAPDTAMEDLVRRGYVRVGDFTAENDFSSISRGYYTTNVKQQGNYSQGVIQQVQDSYRGVNSTTGLTVSGSVSGVITGLAVEEITNEMNAMASVVDPKETLIPVFDDTGVLYYERALNPDLIAQYTQPASNLALMLGAWAGRQVEEKFAKQYNEQLVVELKRIWDERKAGEDDLFIDISSGEVKDPIYRESWAVIPPQTKEMITETFGIEGGFMIRKDMINLALGYRDPSITDMWSGKSRMPKEVRLAVQAATKMMLGPYSERAFSFASKVEEGTMSVVSTAKDFIVVRSLVVPFMNTQLNITQLASKGIGIKAITEGYQNKFGEIDQYTSNVKKIIELEARIQLAGKDKNRVNILKQQRQDIWDQNARMSIAPLVTEGQFKNISEGITDLDVAITSGRLGDWVEKQVSRLPTKVQTIAKYGIVAKDTALYKGANKAVQYGDFIAKSVLYDHLTDVQGLSHEEAMIKVGEEFVNFSFLSGRVRTGLEAVGATWFMTYKIRSMKIALGIIRDNPVRGLLVSAAVDGGPVVDNIAGKAIDGTLPYSVGWDMLWDAPEILPWLNMTK